MMQNPRNAPTTCSGRSKSRIEAISSALPVPIRMIFSCPWKPSQSVRTVNSQTLPSSPVNLNCRYQTKTKAIQADSAQTSHSPNRCIDALLQPHA
jgi:hypothetical protein